MLISLTPDLNGWIDIFREETEAQPHILDNIG